MAARKQYTLDQVDLMLKSVRDFKRWIERKRVELVRRLCERGMEIAKEIAPVDSGELLASIQGLAQGIAGQVIASSGHAAYVEFGTGIVGAGSPHPTLPWAYDVNNHGTAGWWYPKNGTMRWTAGQPARAFMYRAARQLAEEAEAIAMEVFRRD